MPNPTTHSKKKEIVTQRKSRDVLFGNYHFSFDVCLFEGSLPTVWSAYTYTSGMLGACVRACSHAIPYRLLLSTYLGE